MIGKPVFLLFFISALCSVQAVATEAKSAYELITPGEIKPAARRPTPDLSPYTVDAVRAKLPSQLSGQTASLESIFRLYFIPRSNIYDMQQIWIRNGVKKPECIVLGRGNYTLESVYQQINDPDVLTKESEHVYVLSRPLYIAPTASLSLQAGDWLKLSVNDGVFIIYNGQLYVVDAKISSWDKVSADYGQRKALPKETVLMYRVQTPRPYLLGLEGSETYAANSEFLGLGYKGASGTFGLSFSSTVGRQGLGQYLAGLPRPYGWLVGNRIEDLYFGFYTTETSGAVLVGNEFYANLIYGIDPHDYSDNLIIARNVTHGSRFSHGIIVSREVNDSWITQNLTFNNGGSGIMLDRRSSNNLVNGNVALANQGDGIAVFESDHNSVRDNFITRNQRNGVYVRNSQAVDVVDNWIGHNGRNGVELAAVDIGFLETRDFELDPYQQKASAALIQNHFIANYNSAVAGKVFTRLDLFKNRYQSSGPLYFSGDLEPQATALLAYELRKKNPVALLSTPRQGQADKQVQSADKDRTVSESDSIETLEKLARQGVPRAMLALARWYESEAIDQSLYWYGRAAMHSRPSALRGLGLLLMSQPNSTEAQHEEGLALFLMAALLDDFRAKQDVGLLPDILGIAPTRIKKAHHEALHRLRKGQFWNAKLFPETVVRISGNEARLARKRAQRLAYQFSRINPKLADIEKTVEQGDAADYWQDEYLTDWREQSDSKKKLRNLRVATRNALNDRALGDRRQYLDRVEQRRETAEVRLAEITEPERRDLRSRIETLLQTINYHRSSESPIHVDQLNLPYLQAD